MGVFKSKGNLLAVVLAATGFMAAFGIALAATVQVSREIPATLSVAEVEVISDENLVISHDPEGNDPLTSFEFEVIKFQPPLDPNPRTESELFYIRNDSNTDLTLIEPCGDFVDTDSGAVIGFGQAVYADRVPDDTCTGVAIGSGETLLGRFSLEISPEQSAGQHSFTLLFAAVGENGQ